ncbi:MAG TPA: hypothetical protein VGS27_24410, partial [Candidatus Sulfotelmatobacter sp.]|nr:hypothetical protein [Candidatus Sulfotelmatobacter sp.]
GWAATFAVGGEADALVLKALVEKTEAVAAKCGRSALGSIDFDVLTTRWKICHETSYPSPWWSCGIIGLGEILELIYGLQ